MHQKLRCWITLYGLIQPDSVSTAKTGTNKVTVHSTLTDQCTQSVHKYALSVTILQELDLHVWLLPSIIASKI